MKNSAVLASLLFGSFAVAAPFDKRALIYKTEVVTETVVVYTTIYVDDAPVAQATSTPAGYFYEEPKISSSSSVVVSSSSAQAPAYTPPAAAAAPSSAYVAPPQAPAPTPTPAPVPTPSPSPSPAPVVEQPKPVESPKPVETPQPAPAPAPSSAAAAPPAYSAPPAPVKPANGGGSVSGETYSNVDITIYDINEGDHGACGTKLSATDMVVALAQPAWGASTYDVMTGAATNPWCGQKIKVSYEGNSIEATIMDLCPGCSGHDIDLSPAAWKALTGLDEKTRRKASWSKMG